MGLVVDRIELASQSTTAIETLDALRMPRSTQGRESLLGDGFLALGTAHSCGLRSRRFLGLLLLHFVAGALKSVVLELFHTLAAVQFAFVERHARHQITLTARALEAGGMVDVRVKGNSFL